MALDAFNLKAPASVRKNPTCKIPYKINAFVQIIPAAVQKGILHNLSAGLLFPPIKCVGRATGCITIHLALG